MIELFSLVDFSLAAALALPFLAVMVARDLLDPFFAIVRL